MSKTIPIIAADKAGATSAPVAPGVSTTTLEGDGMGCHAGGDQLLAAAKSAGKSEVLDQYAKDYPKNPNAGPHDQPQSMCPAFGSLRGKKANETETNTKNENKETKIKKANKSLT